jgi:alpha-beta hydrolase superfamily lysophospholipase
MVLIVHGLGEHAGRYDPWRRRLNQWGFAVRSYDQYGHGESDGVRGGLPTSNRLLDDLTDLVESSYRRAGPGRAAAPLRPQHGRAGGGQLRVARPQAGRCAGAAPRRCWPCT